MCGNRIVATRIRTRNSSRRRSRLPSLHRDRRCSKVTYLRDRPATYLHRWATMSVSSSFRMFLPSGHARRSGDEAQLRGTRGVTASNNSDISRDTYNVTRSENGPILRANRMYNPFGINCESSILEQQTPIPFESYNTLRVYASVRERFVVPLTRNLSQMVSRLIQEA